MNMNYELCKELKDAGFPKKMVFACGRLNDPTHSDCFADREDCKLEVIGAPTLSELIEACGDDFGKLQKFSPLWYACDLVDESNLLEKGNTPEEAVARLWLALNKKE